MFTPVNPGYVTSGGASCSNPGANLTSAIVSLSGTTATQFVALSGTTRIYVCSMVVGNGGGTTPTFSLQYGTGTNCATGLATILPAVAIPAGSAAPMNFPNQPLFVTPAGQALCYVLTGTTPTGMLTITHLPQ